MSDNDDLIRTRRQEQQHLKDLNDQLRISMREKQKIELQYFLLKETTDTIYEESDREKKELHDAYKNQINNLQNKVNNEFKEKTRALLDADEYKRKYELTQELQKEMENLLQRSKENKEQLSNENRYLKEKKLESDNQINQLTKENQELKYEVRNLKSKLQKCEEHGEELLKKNSYLNEKINNLEIKIKELTNEIDDLQTNLNGSQKDSENLKEKNFKLELELTDLKLKNSSILDTTNEEKEILSLEIEQLKRNRKKIDKPVIDESVFRKMDQKLDEQLRILKECAEKRYNELSDFYNNKNKTEIEKLNEELKQSKSFCETLKSDAKKIEELNIEKNDLFAKVANLEQKLNASENEKLQLNNTFIKSMDEKDKYIESLNEKYQKLQNDFQRFFDTKISIDQEIKVYDELLKSDEDPFKMMKSSNKVQLKSKINYCASPDNNNIIISQHTSDYITIMNTSDKNFILRMGSKLLVSSNDQDQVIFHLFDDIVINAGQSLRVWAKQQLNDNNSDLYANYVMWPTGKNMEATLFDNNGIIISFRKNLENLN